MDKNLETLMDMYTDNSISYNEFHLALYQLEIGLWAEVNSTDTLYDYINHMMRNNIAVSHILNAIEKEPGRTDYWKIDLGYSWNTPKPIRTKRALIEALELEIEDLNVPILGKCKS